MSKTTQKKRRGVFVASHFRSSSPVQSTRYSKSRPARGEQTRGADSSWLASSAQTKTVATHKGSCASNPSGHGPERQSMQLSCERNMGRIARTGPGVPPRPMRRLVGRPALSADPKPNERHASQNSSRTGGHARARRCRQSDQLTDACRSLSVRASGRIRMCRTAAPRCAGRERGSRCLEIVAAASRIDEKSVEQ